MSFTIIQFLSDIVGSRIMDINFFNKSNLVKSVHPSHSVEPDPEQVTGLFNGTGIHGQSRAHYSCQTGLSHDYWGS